MKLTKTAVAVEIAVLLTILVVVEWVAHVLTNTRGMFIPAVLTLTAYLGVRMAVSLRKRRTGVTQESATRH
jgi:hypothetical protein